MRLVALLTGPQTYKRYRNEGHDEAHELVKECEVAVHSSEICHKLGKYYDNPVRIIESAHYSTDNLEIIISFF